MGSSSSTLPKPPSDFEYFVLTFRYPDKIKIAWAPENVLNTIFQATASMARDASYKKDGSYEIKLCDYAFAKTTSNETSFAAKKICCCILADLYAIGWKLVISSDLSQLTDFSTLFFRKFQNKIKHQPSIICVSLRNQDSLQLINAPRSLWANFLEAIERTAGGFREERTFGDHLQVKLNGTPWRTTLLDEGINARKLLLAIFRAFERIKYRFYGTANLKGTADSIFFILDETTKSGSIYQYCAMSLNETDKIHLIDCSIPVLNAIRTVVGKHWTLKDETDLKGSWEFKLKGKPWSAQEDEKVAARLLVTKLLEQLLTMGWSVAVCLDISRRSNDKGLFILRSCLSATVPHFCLSLHDRDKIRLIDAPSDVQIFIKEIIGEHWPPGISRENDYYTSQELKLRGSPWDGYKNSSESLSAKCLMCVILCKLESRKWKVSCSADVSAKYYHNEKGTDYPLDVHSWFIVKNSNSSPQVINNPNLLRP